MKLKIYILLMVMVLSGCEVIKEEDRLIPVSVEQSSKRRHVLLEFTGFRCVNCPTATETAQELQTYYGESLILVSLHPASNPFTQGKYDYTCPAADSIYRMLGGTETTPFPAGNIDMQKYEDSYFAEMRAWTTMTYNAMRDTVAPYLTAHAKADTVSREVTVETQYADLMNVRAELWLVEDSVIGMQAMPDGTTNTAYAHRHMLRAAATEGEPIRVPEACNWKNCSIIALLIDNQSNHIIQAYETTLDFRTDY